MSSTKRPYRITTRAATGYFLGVAKYCHGTYSTLGRAIEAARKMNATNPNDTRAIEYRGQTVRCLYHHGPADTWTP